MYMRIQPIAFSLCRLYVPLSCFVDYMFPSRAPRAEDTVYTRVNVSSKGLGGGERTARHCARFTVHHKTSRVDR